MTHQDDLSGAVERLTALAYNASDDHGPIPLRLYRHHLRTLLSHLTTQSALIGAQEEELGRLRVRQDALALVLDAISEAEEHGDGADDSDCPICQMHTALRAALSQSAPLVSRAPREEVEITLAAGRIMDVFCGGDTTWRTRTDPTEFDNFYESADWQRAVELARAALNPSVEKV